MNQKVLNDMKNFNWQKIIEIGNGLTDLDNQQWRFIKGLVVEKATAKNSGKDGLVYVGSDKDHMDFNWPKHNVTVELKSIFSETLYTKKDQLREKEYNILFNNSNGSNKLDKLVKEQVADYLIVVTSDGAFVVDQDTVIKKADSEGDGFKLKVKIKDVVRLTDNKIIVENAKCLGLRKVLEDAIDKMLDSVQ